MQLHHLDRIRLLSARFRELQGLRLTLAGVCIMLGVGGYLAFSPAPTDNGSLIALALSFSPVIPGVWYLNRYYATTFGRQVGTTPERSRYVSWWVVGYVALGVTLNATVPDFPAGGPTTLTAALVSLWIVFRDWPHRAYYLLVAVAVAVGFGVSASGAGLLPSDLTVGVIFVLLGAAFVPVGVLDHLLLVTLLKDARQAQASRVGATSRE